MFSRFTKIFLCAAMMTGALCTEASAQDMEDFKNRMASAATMMKEDASEALRQYLEIRVQYAGPEVDYSLGRAYQRLYQCEDSQHYYTQVMVAYELPDSNPIYKRAITAFDEIAPCAAWQKVKLSCAMPAGGYVLINNEKMSSCWDRPFSLPDGEHTFKLVGPDGKSKEVKFTAKVGQPDAQIELALDAEKIEVERVVEVEKSYYYKEKFHPALYWGLIAGGLAVAGVGGIFYGMANAARTEEQKYSDLYAQIQNPNGDSDQAKEYFDKSQKANEDVRLHNTLTYTMLGIGGGIAVTGIALAIVSAVSDKELVEMENVNAFVTPTDSGISMGFGVKF